MPAGERSKRRLGGVPPFVLGPADLDHDGLQSSPLSAMNCADRPSRRCGVLNPRHLLVFEKNLPSGHFVTDRHAQGRSKADIVSRNQRDMTGRTRTVNLLGEGPFNRELKPSSERVQTHGVNAVRQLASDCRRSTVHDSAGSPDEWVPSQACAHRRPADISGSPSL